MEVIIVACEPNIQDALEKKLLRHYSKSLCVAKEKTVKVEYEKADKEKVNYEVDCILTVSENRIECTVNSIKLSNNSKSKEETSDEE